jgi:succinate dehydrogenase/fumarate reductase cytochrome b subunit (b558 family)
MEANMQNLRNAVPVAQFLGNAIQEDHFSQDHKWIRHISYEDRQMLKEKAPKCGVEPDFYYEARNLFKNGIMVLLYLVAFVVLFMHMRHAFPSAFQTLGLNNYKYNTAIEVLGSIYTWIICLGFAVVPILVYLGL